MQQVLITFGIANLFAGVAAAWLCDRLGLLSRDPVEGHKTESEPTAEQAGTTFEGSAAPSSAGETGAGIETCRTGPAELGDLLTNWGFDSPPQFVTLVAAQLLATERVRDALTQLDTMLRSEHLETDVEPLVQHARTATETWRRLAAATAEVAVAVDLAEEEAAVQRMSRDHSVELAALAELLGDKQKRHDARLLEDPRQEHVTRLLHVAYTARDALQPVLVRRVQELSTADRAALRELGPASLNDRLAIHDAMDAAPVTESATRYVLRLGVDRFRRLNQLAGAARGDELLAGCRTIFVEALEASGVRAALSHLGGPTFQLLFDGDREQVQLLAETLRQSLEAASFQFGGQTWEVTTSVAVAAWARDEEVDLETRLQRALAAARTAGCNRTAIDEGTPTIVTPAPVPVTRRAVQAS